MSKKQTAETLENMLKQSDAEIKKRGIAMKAACDKSHADDKKARADFTKQK